MLKKKFKWLEILEDNDSQSAVYAKIGIYKECTRYYLENKLLMFHGMDRV